MWNVIEILLCCWLPFFQSLVFPFILALKRKIGCINLNSDAYISGINFTRRTCVLVLLSWLKIPFHTDAEADPTFCYVHWCISWPARETGRMREKEGKNFIRHSSSVTFSSYAVAVKKKNKKQMQHFANTHLCAVYHLKFRVERTRSAVSFRQNMTTQAEKWKL